MWSSEDNLTSWSWFLPSTTYVLGVKLRLSGLGPSVFTTESSCWHQWFQTSEPAILSPKYWDYMVLGTEHSAVFKLGKHSTNWGTSLTRIYFFIIFSYYMCVCMYTCVDVGVLMPWHVCGGHTRGQLERAFSLLSCGSGDWPQVIRYGGKCLYLLSISLAPGFSF